MKRREFCRHMALLGGAVALSPLIKACGPKADPAASATASPVTAPSFPTQPPATPTSPAPAPSAVPEEQAEIPPDPSPEPTVTPVGPVATIALVKTTDRAYGTRRALELLGVNPVRGDRVLLKPNYNSADAAPASTHPDVLRALVTALQNQGARAITVGERSGMGDTRTVLGKTGVLGLGEELGFDTLIFDEVEEKDWIIRQPHDSHWSAGFPVPRALLDAEAVVQTCNLKTHQYGGHFTMSIKNSVGFVARTTSPGGYNYMRELHNSPYQREMIAEINAIYEPALIVVDGVEAFANGGPAAGDLIRPEVVLAGTDRVAMDAVGVAILRLFGTTREVSRGQIFDQTQIARAVELGLGIGEPAQIRFVTGDPESQSYADLIARLL